MSNRQKAYQARRKAEGKCRQCGQIKEDPGASRCDACMAKNRKYRSKKRQPPPIE